MKRIMAFALALLALLALPACGGSDASEIREVRAEDGYAEASMGDTVHSYFMDFTVNSAYTTADYHGHTAPEGKQVLVVELTVKNTFSESLPMYDDDFQGQWASSSETDEYAWPITEGADGVDRDTVAGEQLPAEYELAVGKSRTGTLVFDVPAEEKEFSISHQEFFDDGTQGDTLFVLFTAKQKNGAVTSQLKDLYSQVSSAVSATFS